jgi:hypothetical protein
MAGKNKILLLRYPLLTVVFRMAIISIFLQQELHGLRWC